MEAATEYIAPIKVWFDLLVEIQQQAAGLVTVSIDDEAELRVELTRRGHEWLSRVPAWDESEP